MSRISKSTHSQREPAEYSKQKSNYELFNCNNFNIRYWSWNYRAPSLIGIVYSNGLLRSLIEFDPHTFVLDQ